MMTKSVTKQQALDKKICSKCRKQKHVNDFYLNEKAKDGLKSACKDCLITDTRRYQSKNSEKIKKYKEEWNNKNSSKIAIQKKEWNRSNKERIYEYTKRRRELSPEKNRANYKIRNEIRAGRMIKGDCDDCGTNMNIHAHHDDYSKPLEARWLCHQCHMKLHTNMRRSANG